MKILFNIRTVLVLTCLLAFFSCEYNQEVEDPISTDSYPVATFVTDFTGTAVTEGDTINYTITLDKMLDRAITFTVMQQDGTADENDYTFSEVTIAPYTTEASFQLIINMDDFPEVAETAKLEIGIDAIGQKYLLNPTTVNPVLDLTITNINDPGSVTLAFGWDTPDDDIDVFVISEDNGDWGVAASSDNPEITTSIWTTDPDGKYFLDIDPYYVEGNSINYTLSVGHPDQSVEFFSGVFSLADIDSYTVDYFAYWDMYVYRVAEVVNAGGTFTVTLVNK
jgi:hypothetical protein